MPRSLSALFVVALLAVALAPAAAGAPAAAAPVHVGAAPVDAAAAPVDDGDAASTARSCGGGPVGPTAATDDVTAHDEGKISIDTLVAPGFAHDRLRNASAMHAAMDEGLLVPATMNAGTDSSGGPVVAEDDLVVHRVRLAGNATGLLDRMAAQDRGSPTANVRALVAADGIDFNYYGRGLCPPRLVLNETIDRGALRAVPDERNDTLYLVVDVDETVYQYGNERSSDRWVDGEHRVHLQLRPESGLVDGEVEARDEYVVVPSRATFSATGDDPYLSPNAEPGRTIGGLTTLAVGRTLTVELAFEDGSTTTRTVRVHAHHDEGGPSRHYHATFDLSDVPPGTAFSVTVRRDDAVVGETNGTITNTSASVSLPPREQWTDESIRLAAVSMTDGGFVRVTDGDGVTLGTTQYLTAGTHEDVVVDLDPDDGHRLAGETEPTVVVYVHRDSNDNQLFDRWTDGADPVYMVDGAVVRDEAPIGSPTPSPTPTTAATPTTDGSTGTTATTPDAGTASPTATATGSPGFGPLVALVALLAATVLGVRRHRR